MKSLDVLLKSLFFFVSLLCSIQDVCSQISPLFHLPATNYDLPVFNPAFTGDTDKYRVNYIVTSNNPKVGGIGNNLSHLISVDGKSPLLKSSILLTYGLSMLYNQVDIISDLTNASVNFNRNDLQFTYGAVEFTFGGRLPTRYESSKKRSKNKVSKFVPNKNIKTKPTEAQRSALSPNLWEYCSYNSPKDYLAFNMAVGHTFTALHNVDNGIILNDMISSNPIEGGITSDPFSINSFTNDRLVTDILKEPSKSIYFGFGLLYHYALSRNSVLRFSYGMKNILRTYLSVPESNQVIAPLKLMQLKYQTVQDQMGWQVSLLYLDQNAELYPQPSKPVHQYRLNLGPTFYSNYSGRNYGSGFRWVSIDPGVTIFWFNETISAISTQIGMNFKSNTNFINSITSNNIGRNTRKNYSGNLWYFFIGYDFHTSEKLAHRDTYGNFRLGFKIEGWK